MVADMQKVHNESVDVTVVEDLDMRKVYANMVSKSLMHDQKIMKENVH
jgi:hypothetical protein